MKFIIGNPPVGKFKVFDDDGKDVSKYFESCRSIDIQIRPDDLNSIKIELMGDVEVEVAPENVKAILVTPNIEENGLQDTTAIGDEYRSHSKPEIAKPEETLP